MANDQPVSPPDAPGFRRTTLPDGRALLIRPARAEDIDRMIEFYRGLPLEDRYLRFFTGGLPPRTHFERVVDVATHGGVALVVEVVDGGAPDLVGDACYVPQPDGDGELAVTIDPRWRGWLGPYLLDCLLEAAAANGVMTLYAEILARNRPMLALVRARGCVTVGDDDLSKVRVAVGTSRRTPSWPVRDTRRRILVESSNSRWRCGMAAAAPTVNVMVCAGPPTGYRERCPVLAGQPCPLAAEADAIVVARSDDELGRDLIEAHLHSNRNIPLLIEVATETSAASVPAGSRALRAVCPTRTPLQPFSAPSARGRPPTNKKPADRVAASQVLFATVSAVDGHDTGVGHPERPERLQSVADGIGAADLHDVVTEFNGRRASFDELALVHDEQYLDALARFLHAGGGDLDPDTPTVEASWSTALYAAGTGLVAIESLRRGEGRAAFVAVRPPGHHATATRAMGFCLLNNVAIGAAFLAAAGERVLIVDWDVHHGNGTQQIFWDDSRVLYVSTHQWPAYPGSGRASETGGAGAPGLTVNVPLPPGSSGDAALAAMDEIAAPVIDRFDPTWVLISAGFDAHRDDPLADLVWSAGDFAALTTKVASFAPQPGRVVAFLEGGYDLPALARSAGATVAALAGRHWRPEPMTSGGPGREAVAVAARLRARALGGQL